MIKDNVDRSGKRSLIEITIYKKKYIAPCKDEIIWSINLRRKGLSVVICSASLNEKERRDCTAFMILSFYNYSEE